MAGDWIKFENTTPDKPEVIRMASLLKLDQDAVVGKCVRLWVWADQNSVDGEALEITADFIDRHVNKKGFAKAMKAVGWLDGEDGDYNFPGFGRHNGASAKARAESNRRVADKRERDRLAKQNGNTDVTENALQKPLPEKRREEIEESPLTPASGGEGELRRVMNGVQTLRKHWGASREFSKPEMRKLRGNLSVLLGFDPGDWKVQQDFLAASLPEGSALFQPWNVAKYLENPAECLRHARSWESKVRSRTGDGPTGGLRVMPPPDPADIPTAEERRELLKLNGGKS